MEMHVTQLDNGIRLIKLSGDLDVFGVGQIDTRFTAYSATIRSLVLVDLSEVNFMASIGIHMLTTTSKAVASRGGKMALCQPQPLVANVLEVAGVSSLIPVYTTYDDAAKDLLVFAGS
jgi:anti-sigma B factor antagonist